MVTFAPKFAPKVMRRLVLMLARTEYLVFSKSISRKRSICRLALPLKLMFRARVKFRPYFRGISKSTSVESNPPICTMLIT